MVPNFSYIGLLILTSGALSLFLFFFWQKNHLLKKKPFFWHWMWGVALYALIHAPVIIVNTVRNSNGAQTNLYFLIAFFAFLGSTILFYRGALFFLNPTRFWLNKFPVIWLVLIAVIILVLYLEFGAGVALLSTIAIFGGTAPLALFLGILFLMLYIKRGCFVDYKDRSIGPLLISLAWFSIFVLDIILWLLIWQFPTELWYLHLAALQKWYLARAISITIILIGVTLFYRHLPHIKCVDGPVD